MLDSHVDSRAHLTGHTVQFQQTFNL